MREGWVGLEQVGAPILTLVETVSLVHVLGKLSWTVSMRVLGVRVILRTEVAQMLLVKIWVEYGMVETVNVGVLTDEPVPVG